jgi:hypothetical protein
VVVKWYTPLLWADGKVQQLVDAIAFERMRREKLAWTERR